MNYMEEQAAIDGLTEAAFGVVGGDTRQMALYVIAELEADGSGTRWLEARLSEWAVRGAMNDMKAWLARQKVSKREMDSGDQAAISLQLMQSIARAVDGETITQFEDIRLWDATDAELKENEYARRKKADSRRQDLWKQIKIYCKSNGCLVGDALNALNIVAVDLLEATA